jgi:hypothetical protein
MPSGAVYECNIVDEENQHLSTSLDKPTVVDPCWQRDSTPVNPGQSNENGSENKPVNSDQPVDVNSGDISSSTADELTQIRSGFDKWLDAFRSSRPQRDVIWRVGKYSEKHCTNP